MIRSRQLITTPHQWPDWLEATDLVIDIETTGFSPKFAQIYMIGLAYMDHDGQPILEQWFSEKDSDEYELLYKFNQLIEIYPRLIHYNGDQFDLNFILKRMNNYNLHCHDYLSIDILKRIRPYKNLLRIDNLRLKTVEAYFDYKRDDPFDGGQLTELYKAYRQYPDERLLQTLLLHNYEDLLGLLKVMDHLPLLDLLDALKKEDQPLSLTAATLDQDGFHCRLKLSLNHGYRFEHEWFVLTLSASQLSIDMPVKIGRLKHYFDPPKDYYYLIHEDYAIHKSVGKFVHKDHRIQATRDNCYVHKEGVFLPAYRHFNLPIPLYYEDNSSPLGYASVDELTAQHLLDPYVQQLLKQL